jgi:hypothetical protein
MTEIEERTRYYAACRDDLAAAIHALDAEITVMREQHRAGILDALRAHKRAEDELRAAIEAAPSLFTEPRTRVLHGIRVGYQKGRGGLDIADEAATIKLIHKHLPQQVEALVKVTEKPIKKALQNLDVGTLKKLGVNVLNTGDVIVLAATDGDLDKLIQALQGDDGFAVQECVA